MSMQIKAGVKNYRLTLLAQSILNFLGYEVSSLDGDFGPQTDSAVRQFQHDHGLVVDGIVGEKTWKVLLGTIEPSLEQGDNQEVVSLMGMELGDLSAKWESRGRADAIGNDKHGGYSYGTYQISTRRGTMDKFLWFLKENNRNVYGVLMDAGGAWGAAQGSPIFQKTWIKLAQEQGGDFAQLQARFIAESHYYPLYRKLTGAFLRGVTVGFTFKNVIWSIAVQHGTAGGFNLIQQALNGHDVFRMSAEDIIIRIYDERSKVEIYFVNSTARVKKAVLERFVKEKQAALELLRQEGQVVIPKGNRVIERVETAEA